MSEAIDPPGATVLRLRTKEGAPSRGHALLIGCPFAGLGGVAECLVLVEGWLREHGYEAAGPSVRSTKQGILSELERLRADVRRGDQALVYYAGHGHQELPDVDDHDAPVAMLLPMDADEPAPQGGPIPADLLVEQLRGIARACGADLREPFAGSGAGERSPSMTIVLECCHAAGMMDAWPIDEAKRAKLLQSARRRITGVDRGGFDPEAGVLWVLATGRGEIARGSRSRTVGLMTRAVTTELAKHPGEPWWAVMDRVRATWTDSTQSPGLVGAEALVPLTSERIERPEDWLPCVRDQDAAPWLVELAHVLGWGEGESVMLTPLLAAPAVVHGTLESGAAGLEVRMDDGSALAGGRFAWASRSAAASTALVELWGSNALLRGDVASAIEGSVAEARDLGSGMRTTPKEGCVGLEVSTRGVIVRDRLGDAVACTSLTDASTWLRWIGRLAALERWLAVGTTTKGWPANAFALCWGTWSSSGAREAWTDSVPDLRAGVPVWIDLEAGTTCVPAYVGVFRIKANRDVELLTPHVPGGLPATGRYPLTKLGRDEALRFEWLGCAGNERTEQLVVMVSDRPLPFTTMARTDSVGGTGWDADRVEQRRPARVWMRAMTYLLRR
ncbi:caspase family protein [Paraliomyxa miuraensis]|uniref:caspase family protein n=1 Tax=Paraliomyxa miuraensis TaxID=376150 RepID=UPI0022508D79|nr:caspase family protein [Paraliomyxa miuraensis]MCX4239722.1 caspase family protein [Paraliomyxa miuraensis]